MVRSKLQLLLRRLKRAKWKGPRLQLGKYGCDIHPNGRWYAHIDHKPKARGRWRSVVGAKRAGMTAMRKLIREDLKP